MQAGDIRTAIAGYYREIIRAVTSKDSPSGCLIASVATEISERDEAVREKVSKLLGQAEGLLDARLAAEGYGRTDDGAARGVSGAMVIAAGLSFASRARLGASRPELENVAKDFVECFFAEHPKNTEPTRMGDAS